MGTTVEADMPGGLRHEAVFYEGTAGFLAHAVPFVEAAVDAGESTLVMVGPDKIAALRGALGGTAPGVQFADMHEVGANPAWIIPAWRDFVDECATPDRSLRGIGEPIWAGRSAPELVECQRHEQLLNLAFADAPPFWLLCPYDTRTLAPPVLAAARASHPHLSGTGVPGMPGTGVPGMPGTGVTGAHAGFEGPVGPEFDVALDAAPPGSAELGFDAAALPEVRALVECRAAALAMDAVTTSELVLAIHELATNSVRHGGGRGTLRVWSDGATLVCEVSDCGFVADPLAGRVRPVTDATSHRGLWLAHQLCALVQLRTSPRGTTIRVHARSNRAATR